MTTKTITTYSIAIHADNVWAGTGIYDHTDSGDTVSGDIRDWLDSVGGDSEQLPSDTFSSAESFRSTSVQTRIVTITR